MATVADVKAQTQAELGDKWKDRKWTDFIEEVCVFLLEARVHPEDVVEAIVGLIKYRVKDVEGLREVSSDKAEFALRLRVDGVPPALADKLFAKYVRATPARKLPPDAVADEALIRLDLQRLDLDRYTPPEGGFAEAMGRSGADMLPCLFGTSGSFADGFATNPPDMLLEDLQNPAHRESAAYDFLRRNSVVHTTVMYGTSGAGKTRSVVEFLAHNYGLYVSVVAGSNNPGSEDMATLVTAAISETQALGKTDAVEVDTENRKKVERLLAALLFVRYKVFLAVADCVEARRALALKHEEAAKKALKKAKGKSARREAEGVLRAAEAETARTRFTPYLWLLCQLHPVEFLGVDHFDLAFKRVMERADLDAIKACVMETSDAVFLKLKELIGALDDGAVHKPRLSMPSMFVFVDEAQKLLDTLGQSRFLSAEDEKTGKRKHRSLYGVVVGALLAMSTGVRAYPPVMLGTGLDKTVLDEETGSAVVKTPAVGTQSWKVFTEFKLLSVEEVEAYLNRFLDLGQLCEPLVTHMCRWLRGRPRFTAAFLLSLLAKGDLVPSTAVEETGFYGPAEHLDKCMLSQLNRFLNVLTSPPAGSDTANKRGSWFVSGATPFAVVTKVMRGDDKDMCAALAEAVQDFALSGKAQVVMTSAAELIKVGVCAVRQSRQLDRYNEAELDEPIFADAALQVFRSRGLQEDKLVAEMMKEASNGGGGAEFEELTALAMWSDMAQHVADMAHADDVRAAALRGLVGPTRSTYGVVARSAKGDDAGTMEWWRATLDAKLAGTVEPVLLPSDNFGPDTVMVLRRGADLTDVVPVLVQCKYVVEDSKEAVGAARTVDPELNFVQNRGEAGQKMASHVKQDWELLSRRVYKIEEDTGRTRPVVRVVVSTMKSSKRKSMARSAMIEGFMHPGCKVGERCAARDCAQGVHDLFLCFDQERLQGLLGGAGTVLAHSKRRATRASSSSST